MLFMLAEEAVAAGLTLLAIARHPVSNQWPQEGGGPGDGASRSLHVHIGIASGPCNVLHPDDLTGRQVRASLGRHAQLVTSC